MNDIGHNKPPSMIDTAGEVTSSLSKWMEEHPVVQTEDEAREAKVLIDRAKLCVKDMEAEREGKVKPLNLQVAVINDSYRPARGLLQKVQQEIVRRVTDFLAKEEAKRIKVAEEARKKAEEAERLAKEAEQREQEAIDDARHGVTTDVAAVAQAADESFADYQRASREANLAEREARVRLGGGFTRAMSLRNKETLIVGNAVKAIAVIGLTPDLEAAIIKGARAYRTIHGELPPGIEVIMERSV